MVRADYCGSSDTQDWFLTHLAARLFLCGGCWPINEQVLERLAVVAAGLVMIPLVVLEQLTVEPRGLRTGAGSLVNG